MNIITSKPIIVAGQNDNYSNLKGGSPKAEIIAFQNWAVSKGYIPSSEANGKWNIPTDTAYDNYGKVYEAEKGGTFRFDLLPNIKSLTETKTGYPSSDSSGMKTLPTLDTTAIRPNPPATSNRKKWLWIGLGVLVAGVVVYKISKSKK